LNINKKNAFLTRPLSARTMEVPLTPSIQGQLIPRSLCGGYFPAICEATPMQPEIGESTRGVQYSELHGVFRMMQDAKAVDLLPQKPRPITEWLNSI
jgi:hypothetical protein